MTDPLPGIIRGRYERLGVLGSGSQGEVSLCLDRQHDRRVAIKSRRVRSPDDRERVLAEARVLLKMRPHPGVALVREDFFEGDHYYIVMDWIEGRSLSKLLVEERPAFDDVIRWLGQIAEAIDHLHAHDPPIIHQDVKPANIVLTANGDAVLVDFGVAMHHGRQPLEGTLAYSAPELTHGAPPSPASDVYSLGVTAYELLTGTLPDPEMPRAFAMLVAAQRLHVREGLRAALSSDPAARPPTATAFVESLGSLPLDLPPMLGVQSSTMLVDRRAAVSSIRAIWDEVLDGASRLVLVAGEPGIGKTRLIAEVARMLYDGGATVLFGRTDPEPLSPFQPFVEALSHYAEHCPAARLRADVPRTAAELALLLPVLHDRIPELEPLADVHPETRRHRLFDAVASLLLAIARDAPLVIVLDDLHWADRSTLALLDHLLRRSGSVRMLIVGAFRESEVEPSHPLAEVLARYRSGGGISQISLEGLEEADVADLLASTTGHRAPESLVREISAGTRGNPLFVHEMSRHLVESETVTAEGRWREVDLEKLGVPRGVGALIESRVARLAEESRSVLDAAAVAGREFELALIERVVGGDPLPAIEQAIRARLVEEEPGAVGRFSFSHALFRQSIYEQLTPSRRVRMHAQIADALENLGEWEPGIRLGDLAHHTYMAARAGGVEAARRSVPYSVRAGDAASDSAAFEEAVAHFQRADELMEMSGAPETDRMDVLLKIAENGSRVGLWAEMRHAAYSAAAIARSIGSPETLARCALSMFGGVFVDPMQVRKEDRALLDEALVSFPGTDSSIRAQLLTWRSWMMYSDPRSPPEFLSEINAVSDQALAMARRLDDARTKAFTAVYYVGARLDPSFTPELVGVSEEAVALARTAGWVDLLGHALEFHATALIKHGNLDAAVAPVAELEELGRLVPIHAWMATSSRMCLATLKGRLDEADMFAALGQEHLERGRSQSLLFSHFSAVVELRRLQGRLDEVLPILEGFTKMAPKVAYIRCVLAAALVEADRLALAREHFELLVAEGMKKLSGSFLFGRNAMAYLASICCGLVDAERGESMYEVLGPFADIQLSDGRPPAGCHGFGAHYLGMLSGLLGRHEEAERHFERALELHEGMRSPPWIVETKYRFAEMLLSRAPRELDRAAGLLAEARVGAEASGLTGLVNPIRAVENELRSRRQ